MVLDIGANIGQYASLLRSCGFDGQIVSCEPLTDAYAKLSRRSSGDSNWESLQTAVGPNVGEAEIHVAANSYSSSLLPTTARLRTAYPGAVASTVERVEVTTVAALVASRDLTPSRSLLKIDTQGFESEVLDGAGDMLKEFGAIQLELSFVPLYDGQALYADLVDRLDRIGFVLFTSETGISDPTTGQLLQCDALFVRRDRLATGDGAGGASAA